ncbi:DUF1289 domain-containing protein [Rhizobiales bacterium]|uniref:DUF1289 domain-containing protein n=1 Tax=Hongsoonwoonella zoysiae TaxID=2821844 RepID=UPI001560EBFF|nr:DUF1289 domain-containing protein [Hongsoonwoonella zoysiae]NRG18330.1 DUF1289 domain-containing protein [Hongsoonwoonella zoysiae]
MTVLESPCINVCQIDRKSGLCLGCYRTLDEIAVWSTLKYEDRRAIMDELGARRSSLPEAG